MKIKWLGEADSEPEGFKGRYEVKQMYSGFQYGKLEVQRGDHVLIRNCDTADEDSYDTGDVARIVCLYETDQLTVNESDCFRATVEWYTRPKQIPKSAKFTNNDKFNHDKFHPTREVLLEGRKFDSDIDVESIFAKCQLVKAKPEDDPEELITRHSNGLPVFVSRFCLQQAGGRLTLCSLEEGANRACKKGQGARRSLGGQLQGRREHEATPSPMKKSVEVMSPELPRLGPVVKYKMRGIGMSPLKTPTKTPPKSASKRKRDVEDSSARKRSKLSEAVVSRKVVTDEDYTQVEAVTKSMRKVRFICYRENRKPAAADLKATSRSVKVGDDDILNLLNDDDVGPVDTPSPKKSSKRIAQLASPADSPVTKRAYRSPKVVTPSKSPKSGTSSQSPNIVTPRKRGNASTPSQAKRQLLLDDYNSGDEDWSAPNRKKKKKLPAPRTPTSRTPAGTPTRNTTRTPSSTRTPSTPLPSRQTPLAAPHTPLEAASHFLQVSLVPPSLPCREQEFSDIFNFVSSKLCSGTGGCMYISGVPGTGKTATVKEVVAQLQEAEGEDGLPNFQFVELNGMRLTAPQQAFVELWKAISGQKATADQAQGLLEKRFRNGGGGRKNSILLLVDELDLLCTRKQSVMYSLFEWPSWKSSKLVVIAIANTMDLPERVMMSRVSSRLGLTRMTFHPYTHEQLRQIIASRLEGLKVFDPDAIQLVSRKVAAVSGDARRALDICRRAVQIAEEKSGVSASKSPRKKPKNGLVAVTVGMSHVNAALQEMCSSPTVMAVKQCSEIEQLFIAALLSEFKRRGLEEAVFGKAYEILVSLCAFEGLRVPSVTEALEMCARLVLCKLLLSEPGKRGEAQRIWLNVNTDDVTYALRNAGDI